MRRTATLVVAALAAACSSSSSNETPPPPTDSGVDAAPDTAPATGLKVQTFQRVGVGAPEAHVAAIKPDGTVLAETVTDKDGVGTLAGFSFGADLVYLVSWKTGWSVEVEAFDQASAVRWRALSEVAKDAPYPTWIMPQVASHPKLSGAVTGISSDKLVVTSSVGVGAYDGPSANYSLRVRPAEKGTLVALAYGAVWSGRTLDQTLVQWLQLDQPAVPADTTLDLDLAKATKLTPKTAKLTLTIPGGATGPFGADSLGFATTYLAGGSWVFTGAATKSAPSTDGGSFDVTMQYVEPTIPGGATVTYAKLIRAADGAFAERVLEGVPKDGDVIKDFDPPIAVAATKQTFADPISFAGAPAGADVMVIYSKSTGDVPFRMYVPSELIKSATKIPPLPAEALAMVPASMTVRLATVREPFRKGESAHYSSFSKTFILTK